MKSISKLSFLFLSTVGKEIQHGDYFPYIGERRQPRGGPGKHSWLVGLTLQWNLICII